MGGGMEWSLDIVITVISVWVCLDFNIEAGLELGFLDEVYSGGQYIGGWYGVEFGNGYYWSLGLRLVWMIILMLTWNWGFLVRSVVGRMDWSLDIGITGVWVCLDYHNEVVLELCFLGEVCRGGGRSGLWNVWYMIGNIFGYGFKFYI